MESLPQNQSPIQPEEDDTYGYDESRFPQDPPDDFQCCICLNTVKDPQQCGSCGIIFCELCINHWQRIKKTCPVRCKVSTGWSENRITGLAFEKQKAYDNIMIFCRYQNCKKLIKMGNLKAHERGCQRSIQMKNEIQKPKLIMKDDPQTGIFNFQWDENTAGENIQFLNNGKNIFLNEKIYKFKTVLGNKPMHQGYFYWEIIPDYRSEFFLKIGVSRNKDFDMNTSFSDFKFGYAYFGQGSLRHGSAKSGQKYGRPFKNDGTVGVFLDMNKGTLSFALNGEYHGIAFRSEELTQGPIYPAISLIHVSGCEVISGIEAPEYMLAPCRYSHDPSPEGEFEKPQNYQLPKPIVGEAYQKK